MNSTNNNNSTSLGLSSKIDWITILIYVALVVVGWVSIYAAVYDDDNKAIYDIGQRYGMQLLWIGVSSVAALLVLFTDSKYYHMTAYPLYGLNILLLIAALVFGREVNGAKSWLPMGPFSLQPVEFMKITTALALARFMSSYNFDIRKMRSLVYIAAIIFTPVLIVLLQNDTGSALVFFTFFIILYREGFDKTLYLLVAFMILLFVLSFLLEPVVLLLIIIGILALFFLVTTKLLLPLTRFILLLTLFYCSIEIVNMLLGLAIDLYYVLLSALALTMPALIMWSFKTQMRKVWSYIVIIFAAIAFTHAVDFMFDNVLQYHQQRRILDMLGIDSDPQRWSYNVNQSKIAIGSGGLLGKGFLEGTQTKFSFVPEQSTDFIFCTIGEEWGFLGSLTVIGLFVVLIYRLMKMGERQNEPFARVYCYSVAAILFTHFFINIGMTIGFVPVVGIPLPFISYGGSSLLAFTILLFIAIRLDTTQNT